jgi:hypothetical protein
MEVIPLLLLPAQAHSKDLTTSCYHSGLGGSLRGGLPCLSHFTVDPTLVFNPRNEWRSGGLPLGDWEPCLHKSMLVFAVIPPLCLSPFSELVGTACPTDLMDGQRRPQKVFESVPYAAGCSWWLQLN